MAQEAKKQNYTNQFDILTRRELSALIQLYTDRLIETTPPLSVEETDRLLGLIDAYRAK